MRFFLLVLLLCTTLPVSGQDVVLNKNPLAQSTASQDELDQTRHIPLAHSPKHVGGNTNLETPVAVSFLSGRITDVDLLVLSSGELLVIYREAVDLNQSMVNTAGVKSFDNGLTWGEPIDILPSSMYAFKGSTIATASGRILVIQQDAEPNQMSIIYSDDNGETWEEPIALLFPIDDGTDHKLSQTNEGTLWLFYERRNQGRGRKRAFYRTSSDDGLTWTGAQLFIDAEDGIESPMLVSDTTGVFTALFSVYQEDSEAYLAKSTSNDGGLTWSEPESIVKDSLILTFNFGDTQVLHTPGADSIYAFYHTDKESALGFLNTDFNLF